MIFNSYILTTWSLNQPHQNITILHWWGIHSTLGITALDAEIRSLNDRQLDFILEFSQMTLNMGGNQGNCTKQLSKHTAVTTLAIELLVYVDTF